MCWRAVVVATTLIVAAALFSLELSRGWGDPLAIWQDGDIVVSFRETNAPTNVRLAAWSADGATFRGTVDVSPPIGDSDSAPQHLTMYNNLLYGRVATGSSRRIVHMDGSAANADDFYAVGSGGGGGLAVDSAGKFYVGDSSGSPDFDYQIAKLNTDGSVDSLYVYDPFDINMIGDGGGSNIDANTVRVNPSGTIAYFTDAHGDVELSSSELALNRLDLVTGSLLTYLDFTSQLTNPRWLQNFAIGPDGRIWGCYQDTADGQRIFVADPDGTVVQDWFTLADNFLTELLALRTDGALLAINCNEFPGPVSRIRAYNESGAQQYVINYSEDELGQPASGLVFVPPASTVRRPRVQIVWPF